MFKFVSLKKMHLSPDIFQKFSRETWTAKLPKMSKLFRDFSARSEKTLCFIIERAKSPWSLLNTFMFQEGMRHFDFKDPMAICPKAASGQNKKIFWPHFGNGSENSKKKISKPVAARGNSQTCENQGLLLNLLHKHFKLDKICKTKLNARLDLFYFASRFLDKPLCI